ncbi:MAG: hypothetical protein U0V74_17190 [Chitinophagales bacterium]
MELNYLRKIAFAAATLAVLATTSCKKEIPQGPDTTDKDSNSAKVADNAYVELVNVITAVSSGESFKTGSILSCAVITKDTTITPHVISIDFGTGCTGSDGTVRSGVISATYNTTKMQTVGCLINATFDHYQANDHMINGTMTIENKGFNGAGFMNFDVTINATEDRFSSNTTITANGMVNYEFVAGQTTGTKEDDQLSISGALSGVDQVGRQYHATINSPLIKSRATGCDQYFVAGNITYVKPNTADATYDYGSGQCDDIATLTQSGNTSTVHLSN